MREIGGEEIFAAIITVMYLSIFISLHSELSLTVSQAMVKILSWSGKNSSSSLDNSFLSLSHIKFVPSFASEYGSWRLHNWIHWKVFQSFLKHASLFCFLYTLALWWCISYSKLNIHNPTLPFLVTIFTPLPHCPTNRPTKLLFTCCGAGKKKKKTVLKHLIWRKGPYC